MSLSCVGDWPEGTTGWNDTGLNVIYVTLDGARWQEFFRGTEPGAESPANQLLPKFWANWAPLGEVYGDPARGGRAVVSNSMNVSQPAYESMFAGQVTECLSNTCPQVKRETVLDRLRKDTTIPRELIGTFASWDRIKYVVTSKPETCCVVNAGSIDFDDGTNDAQHAAINTAMRTEELPPWTHLKDGELPADGIRWDRHTFAHAKRFIEKNRPRFTYISFVDTDELGHWERWSDYEEAMRMSDGFLDELRTLLDSMGEYGQKTVLIVSTDHGRGSLHQWGWHGPFWPTSRDIWMYVQLPRAGGFTLLDPATVEVQHRDLRPTFEALLGLEPSTCDGCGRSIVVKAP